MLANLFSQRLPVSINLSIHHIAPKDFLHSEQVLIVSNWFIERNRSFDFNIAVLMLPRRQGWVALSRVLRMDLISQLDHLFQSVHIILLKPEEILHSCFEKKVFVSHSIGKLDSRFP